jgi:hypothetical protein
MITLNHVPAAGRSGEYWEVSLVEAGRPSHYFRSTEAACITFQAELAAQIAADQQRDPTETLQRSWLRRMGEPDAALPARVNDQTPVPRDTRTARSKRS